MSVAVSESPKGVDLSAIEQYIESHTIDELDRYYCEQLMREVDSNKRKEIERLDLPLSEDWWVRARQMVFRAVASSRHGVIAGDGAQMHHAV
jgi:hypothetical protein